jgi:hypothetical protein
MEHLPEAHQEIIDAFHIALEHIVTIDDMFPPEEGGVREPAPRPLPFAPSAEAIALPGLVKVHALCVC